MFLNSRSNEGLIVSKHQFLPVLVLTSTDCVPVFPVRPVHEKSVPANDEEVTEENISYLPTWFIGRM